MEVFRNLINYSLYSTILARDLWSKLGELQVVSGGKRTSPLPPIYLRSCLIGKFLATFEANTINTILATIFRNVESILE